MNFYRNICYLLLALISELSLAQQQTWTPCLISSTFVAIERANGEEVCAREVAEARQRGTDKMLESRLLSKYAEFLADRNEVARAEILEREALALLEALDATNVNLGWRIHRILYLMSRQEKFAEALPLLFRLKAISGSVSEPVRVDFKRILENFAVRLLEMQMDPEAAALVDDSRELLALRKRMSPPRHVVEPLVPIALAARYKVVSHPELSVMEIERLIGGTSEKISGLLVKKDFSQLPDVMREFDQIGIPVKEMPSAGLQHLLARVAESRELPDEVAYHKAYARAIALSVLAVGNGSSPSTAYQSLMSGDVESWYSTRPTFSREGAERKQIGDRVFDIRTVKSTQGISRIAYFDETERWLSETRIFEKRVSGKTRGGPRNAAGVETTLAMAGSMASWQPEAGDLATANTAAGKDSLQLRSRVGAGLKVTAYVLNSATTNAKQAPECFMEFYHLMGSELMSKLAKKVFQLHIGDNTLLLPMDAYLPGKCGFQPTKLFFNVEMSGVSTSPSNSSLQATSFEIRTDAPNRPATLVTCAVCSAGREPFLKCDADPYRFLPVSRSQKSIEIDFDVSPTPKEACKPFDVANTDPVGPR